ncbi:MAG: hypothetical protein IKA58_06445, partial [Clostridia bacterium]|nr:hypothetical protein [Clostridia bacterium]
NVASGIEYAMLMTENAEKISFEQRVTSSLDAIMKLYEVPAEIREMPGISHGNYNIKHITKRRNLLCGKSTLRPSLP